MLPARIQLLQPRHQQVHGFHSLQGIHFAEKLYFLRGADAQRLGIPVRHPATLVQGVGWHDGKSVTLPVLLRIGNHFAKSIGKVLQGVWNGHHWIVGKVTDIALPDAQRAGLGVQQFKPSPALANNSKQVGLQGLELPNVCKAAVTVQNRCLAWNLNFAPFLKPHHTKRLLL